MGILINGVKLDGLQHMLVLEALQHRQLYYQKEYRASKAGSGSEAQMECASERFDRLINLLKEKP